MEALACEITGARYIEIASGHFMPHQTPELFLEDGAALPEGVLGDLSAARPQVWRGGGLAVSG